MEDGGDDGDGYDYSPPEDDFILTGNDVHAKTAVRHYRYLSTMEIAFTMALPKDMESRKQRIADGSMDIKFI
ncbi:hypothetical protein C823_001236 [Eubacterium plexicaudatum ASF492]|nr:hypothetical protein C823_001236 [Eubacterium plexicaudatum ASF492]